MALGTGPPDAIVRSASGASVHVINLSLLPLSREDRGHTDHLLDRGAVVILSRRF